ncbi:Glycosyltransferase [Klebsiella pneumoniae IS39]|nr:Glycosyltransferase [Klebsiella pneumoniae IS39]
MIHYAGENKPWNTEKVDFYDDFIENIVNTPWEMEIYKTSDVVSGFDWFNP